jgi:hypothetical protein
MNNGFLTEVSSIEHAATYADPQIDTLHRNAHQRATVAPLYGFDISRRACWATLFEVGTSRYSGWADESEAQAKARSEHKKLSDLAPSETGKETPLAV